jgi:hypothetical protein
MTVMYVLMVKLLCQTLMRWIFDTGYLVPHHLPLEGNGTYPYLLGSEPAARGTRGTGPDRIILSGCKVKSLILICEFLFILGLNRFKSNYS